MIDFQKIMLAKAKIMTTIFMKNNLEGESWASVHDSQTTDELLDEKGQGEEFYADSAYSGKP